MNRLLPIFAAALALGLPFSASAAEKRPNFLFILTDDQAPETIGAYGNTLCATPNIDRLAREGMLFHGAHHMGAWVGAVCLPSRTMIMTGRTVWNLPNYRSAPPNQKPKGKKAKPAARGEVETDPAQFSLPAIFNRAGYATMRTCKMGNSYEPANKLFSVRHDATKRGGTAESGSAWHADRVLDFLAARHAAKAADPFLIYFGFSHPHDPRNGPEHLAKKYGANNQAAPDKPDPGAPPLPVNYLPAHPFHHGHPGLRDEVSVQGVGENRDEATVRNEIGRDYACIENIDIQIGRVLDKLEAAGELDNTYIIFTADHGMSVGRHGLMGKQNLYEHTWRVPFIVRGPGIKAGSESGALIYLLDVLPTLCDLAGIESPDSVEGQSFRPVLEGKADSARPHVYGVYAGGTKPGIRAIKTGQWKLVKWDALDGKVRQTQLFDLGRNPDELLAEHHAEALAKQIGNTPDPDQRNLADDPDFAAKRAELEALLLAEMVRLGDPYRLWDQPADAPKPE